MNATHEQWKPVVGYEGFYEVSDHGHVRSLDRWVQGPHTLRIHRARDLRPVVDAGGYRIIGLNRDGVRKHLRVHRLVAAAFIGEPPEGTEVCHNDGDPGNNRVENLRYDTKKANGQDTLKHGRNFMANKTYCIRGHEFTPGNTYFAPPDGRRVCRVCSRARHAKWVKRQSARTGGSNP